MDHNRPVVSIGGSENVTLVHLSLSGGSSGLQVSPGTNVTAYGVVAEHNVVHTKIGVNVTTNSQATFVGPNQIRINGSPNEPTRAGVRVDGNSNAFDQGTVVRGNAGPGVLVDLNSSIDATAAVVRGNATKPFASGTCRSPTSDPTRLSGPTGAGR